MTRRMSGNRHNLRARCEKLRGELGSCRAAPAGRTRQPAGAGCRLPDLQLEELAAVAGEILAAVDVDVLGTPLGHPAHAELLVQGLDSDNQTNKQYRTDRTFCTQNTAIKLIW